MAPNFCKSLTQEKQSERKPKKTVYQIDSKFIRLCLDALLMLVYVCLYLSLSVRLCLSICLHLSLSTCQTLRKHYAFHLDLASVWLCLALSCEGGFSLFTFRAPKTSALSKTAQDRAAWLQNIKETSSRSPSGKGGVAHFVSTKISYFCGGRFCWRNRWEIMICRKCTLKCFMGT